jgi:hypothetical protein
MVKAEPINTIEERLIEVAVFNVIVPPAIKSFKLGKLSDGRAFHVGLRPPA